MKTWGFLTNPFLTCSDDSFPVMRKVGNYTVNSLHRFPSDTFLSARYNILFPLNKSYSDKYTIWDAQQAQQLSGTASFKTLRKELSGKKARKWDNTLQNTYDRDSDKYLNFSSRVGYHYGVLDCYCGRTANKNYITFSFKGGAADDVKRGRRARAIALMLEDEGFLVETTADRVVGRFTKCDAAIIAEKLKAMGRLLQFTRQTDMLMTSEASVQAMADSFRAGHDHFDPARDMPQ